MSSVFWRRTGLLQGKCPLSLMNGLFKLQKWAFRAFKTRTVRSEPIFREGDEDSNFSVFRVRRFSEWPKPLHWIAFPVEIPTKPPIHWIASPLFTENPLFFSLRSASSHPLPHNRLWERTFCAKFTTSHSPGWLHRGLHRSGFPQREQRWFSALRIALHKSLSFWFRLKPWKRVIHIVACKSTSYRRLASRDLANLASETHKIYDFQSEPKWTNTPRRQATMKRKRWDALA